MRTIREMALVYEGMGCNERIIHVCVNVDCALRGSEAVMTRLRELADEWNADVEINEYVCFAACEEGPNVLIEHNRAFYGGVTQSDAEGVLEHALGGPPVAGIDRSTSFIARKVFNMLDAGFRPGDLSLAD